MSKPLLLVVGRPAPYIAERIGAAFTPVTPESVSDEQRRTLRGVAVCAAAPFDADMLAGFPALEIAANFGVGYDNVDARAAAARGVIVTNTPDVLTEEVADLAIGLLIATVRKLPQADGYLRRGGWLEKPFPFTATLRTRSFGILGLGRIGRAVAARLEPFGRPIAYHGRRRQPDVPYRYYPSLVAMAEDVDTLIVVAPGGAETKGIVNAEVLAALGADGIVINVGRGTVVDEAALIDALAQKVILSAGLDVFEDEPRVPSALIGMEHIVLLPHVGSASTHTRAAMAQLMVDNLVSWFAGRGPLTPVPETPWPRR